MKFLKKIAFYIVISPVKFYKYFISPFTPSSCRHVPTCSTYFIESVKVHGVFRGTWLGLKRLSTCHPWGSHGYDPVLPKGVNKLKFKNIDLNKYE